MTILNPDFAAPEADSEYIGDHPEEALGLAASWVSWYKNSCEEWASFHQEPVDVFTLTYEGFEHGWLDDVAQVFIAAFQGLTIDLEAAVIGHGPGQTGVENFERGWPLVLGEAIRTHNGFIPYLMSSEIVRFDSLDQERFETWVSFMAFNLEAAPGTTTGIFNTEGFESFEIGWGTAATLAGSVAAVFGTDAFESFETAWVD